MFGIEKLKKLFDFLFSATALGLTIDKDGDGKLEFTEIFSALTSSVIMRLPGMFQDIGDLKDEAGDLTAEELEELVAHIQQKAYLPASHEDLEKFIKTTLNWIAYNIRYVKIAKSFFTK